MDASREGDVAERAARRRKLSKGAMNMHDIDRTLGHTNMETGYEFQGEEEAGEFQSEMGEVLGEEEMNELATELLSVTHERELEQFFSDVFNKVKGAVSNFARSSVGQQVGGMLKNVAKQALPALGQMAGTALGGYVGMPGLGGQLGGQLASGLGSAFGLELEGLSHEDRDFEVAKQFVRLTADAAQNAQHAPPGQNPAVVAQNAIAEAAQKYAPGLLEPHGGPGIAAGGPSPRGAAHGRWVRKGNKIVLYGV
jgi:hypothetical protein